MFLHTAAENISKISVVKTMIVELSALQKSHNYLGL